MNIYNAALFSTILALMSSTAIAGGTDDKKEAAGMTALVAKLNDSGVQQKLLKAARTAILEELKREGIPATPEMLARIATANAKGDQDAAETLAAGAVFVATVGLFSDERLKHDIVLVGKSPSGINVYDFSYNGHTSRWRGVLAQELLATNPEAVFQDGSGYLVVNYSKIDVRFERSELAFP